MTSAYNEVTRGVPHCYPVSVEDFTPVVAPAAEGGSSQDRLHSDVAFVAREGASILGFIHVAIERLEEAEETEEGIVRFVAWDNFRAFLFYSNYGYRVADWTYGLRREME